MQDLAQTLRDCNLTSVDFLRIEADTGLMFAGIAKRAGRGEKAVRNRANARLAYDTVLRFLDRVTLTASESANLALKMAKLKRDLENLGELF
jgi:hypothetical protein